MSLSYEDYYNLILENPWKISIIPKNHIDYNLLDRALSTDGKVLEILKMRNLLDLVTEDLFEIAVQSNGEALAFVPEEKITERMCVNALTGAQGSEKNIKYIPNKFNK